MMSDDLTVHILTEIRDAVRGTNERVDEVRDAVRGTNERVDQLRDEISGVRDGVRGTNERVDELRDAVRGTNERVDELRDAVRGTNERVDRLRVELRGEIGEVRDRLVETDLRLATQFVAMTAAHRDVYDLLQDRFDLRDRVERVEHDVAELKRRGGSSS